MKKILPLSIGLLFLISIGKTVYAADCTVSYNDTILTMPVGGCGDPFRHGPYENAQTASYARAAAGHPYPDYGSWIGSGIYYGWQGLKAGDFVDGSCANITQPHFVTHVYYYYTGSCVVEELSSDKNGNGIPDQEDLDYIDTKNKEIGITWGSCRINRDQNMIGQ